MRTTVQPLLYKKPLSGLTKIVNDRLAEIGIELSNAPKFDYIITNDDLQKAQAELEALVKKVIVNS